ncbi:pentapeptide repeat-containing protein [Streptomyces sp. NPDC127112]|uniref:pentapeptide repeat-containing protein n=1 Tax=Streptomyces sp. NPDC127112 TaxID=3345364 RepID=UPI00362D2317
MTMLIRLLDYLSTVPNPSPSATPASNQSTSSGTPFWATLLVGLVVALFGGAGAFAGAWRSAGALRRNTERTLEHERTRLLNERFSTAAELLGHNEAACRLAGVHAMAGLADDWTERRQTCIDVLCAYLRMPYAGLEKDAPEDAPASEHLNRRANHEVRLTAIRTIRDHLLPNALPESSWSGYDFDFTGAVFDGGDFSGVRFSGGHVSFSGAEFSGGVVDFSGAEFSSGDVSFVDAMFFSGRVEFGGADFSGGSMYFADAKFSGGEVLFGVKRSSDIYFAAKFSGSLVHFDRAEFTGSNVDFGGVRFSDGWVSFPCAKFSDGRVSFPRAKFSGATVKFQTAQFDGGVVDMQDVATWSRPPSFDADVLTTPPAGLLLPDPTPKPLRERTGPA